jgi:glycosyltransferase involved in cell wall biosynthesis
MNQFKVNMSIPKVSVVIPIYGVERYIEKCVRSLFEQTLDSIEYIFVNDCTPDASMDIVKRVVQEYPQRMEQLVIINHPYNMGGGKARKTGIKAASGEYIIHCDSDDWVDIHMYEDLYEKAKREGLDCVICSSYYGTDGKSCSIERAEVPLDKYEFIEQLLYWKTPVTLYSFLVKRDVYQSPQLMMPAYHMSEDRVYSLQFVYLANNYGFTDTPYYYYLSRPDSIWGNKSQDGLLNSFQQAWENMKTAEAFLKKNNLLKRYAHPLSYCRYIMIVTFLLPLVKQDNSYHKLYAKMCFSIKPSLLRSNRLTLAMKISCIFTCIGIYPTISRIKVQK